MSAERREQIIELLKTSSGPISASALAKSLAVSRQVIVGDIALLRAAGETISATPKGYLYTGHESAPPFGYVGLIACKHDPEQLQAELYTVVDFGGTVIDVTIEHSLYGQLSGLLDIASRYDADVFAEKVRGGHGKPLSALTDGIHLHRIGCKDRENFLMIEEKLQEKNILYR